MKNVVILTIQTPRTDNSYYKKNISGTANPSHPIQTTHIRILLILKPTTTNLKQRKQSHTSIYDTDPTHGNIYLINIDDTIIIRGLKCLDQNRKIINL